MKRFDLNLLRVLVLLDEKRSVTAAAEALEMSQSGFSMALKRLREQFDDPLFVRAEGGMQPTPRAVKLIDTARSTLSTVEAGLFEQDSFDPATSRTQYRLVLNDAAEASLMPPLVRHLAQHAPHVQLRLLPRDTPNLEVAMQRGEIDLALGLFPEMDRQSFFRQRLFTHTYVCIMRSGHPFAHEPLTIATYGQLPHAAVATPSRATQLYERALELHGIEPRVAMYTTHYMSLHVIVASSDLIATVPLSTGMALAERGFLLLRPLPFEPPRFVAHQHWHRLFQHDPRNQWLRQQAATLFQTEAERWLDMEHRLYGKPAAPLAAAGA